MHFISWTCTAIQVVSYNTEYAYMLLFLPFFLSYVLVHLCTQYSCMACEYSHNQRKHFTMDWCFVYTWCIWLTSAVLSICIKSVSFFTCVCNCNGTELQQSSDGDVWGLYNITVEFHNNSICGYTVVCLKRVYNLPIRKVSWFGQLHQDYPLRQAT